MTNEEKRAALRCAENYPAHVPTQAWHSRRVSNAEEIAQYG